MNINFKKYFAAFMIVLAGIILLPTLKYEKVFACDETLILILTSKNPDSEFSKIIRQFSSNLTQLGTALNQKNTEQYEPSLNNLMNTWLELSKRYLNSPPPEATNDPHWMHKMSETAKSIGHIRRLVADNKPEKGHDKVLKLSARIGYFFEGFGIDEQKQLFISSSSNLTELERLLSRRDRLSSLNKINKLQKNLDEFKTRIPETSQVIAQNTENLLKVINKKIKNKETVSISTIEKLKVKFETMRSTILLEEWFPEAPSEIQEM